MRTVLFDLDGTLLPMDMDVFVNSYFQLLVKKMIPYGYDPQKLIREVWKGTAAMVANDGSCRNEEAFWNYFCGVYGEEARAHIPVFEEFYEKEFQEAKAFCGFNPLALQTVRLVKELGLRAVLATNPLFPAVATHSRVRWAGLEPEMFEYCTTYENIGYCKPNPEYYAQVLRVIGETPENCLMVGNDVSEDMIAQQLGMDVFLLTDCLINKEGKDISVYPHGGFPELQEYLRKLA